MAHYWIKLYTEILNDPKMCRLPDKLYRRVIEIFLLAGDENSDGLLPDIEDMAWRLRLDPDELEKDLIQLERAKIVEQTEQGWYVTNFARRQSASPVGDRVKRYRNEQRKDQYHGNDDVTKRYMDDNESVTTRYTESDKIRIESESDTNVTNRNNGDGWIFKLYESEIGVISPTISDDLQDMEGEYQKDWIEASFRIAAQNNKRNVAYIRGILKRWKADGQMSILTKAEKAAAINPEDLASEVY